MPHPTCVVVENGAICGARAKDKGRGLCGKHHARFYRTGNPLTVRKPRVRRGPTHPQLQDAAWLREHYIARRLSCQAIADLIATSFSSVLRALRFHAIPVRPPQCGRHGYSGGRNGSRSIYTTWQGMIRRCTAPGAVGWEHYGGRGIAVCDRWRLFENFLADMGDKPEGKSLDRIDVNGNYEPGNCRWATGAEQEANKRPVHEAILAGFALGVSLAGSEHPEDAEIVQRALEIARSQPERYPLVSRA